MNSTIFCSCTCLSLNEGMPAIEERKLTLLLFTACSSLSRTASQRSLWRPWWIPFPVCPPSLQGPGHLHTNLLFKKNFKKQYFNQITFKIQNLFEKNLDFKSNTITLKKTRSKKPFENRYFNKKGDLYSKNFQNSRCYWHKPL